MTYRTDSSSAYDRPNNDNNSSLSYQRITSDSYASHYQQDRVQTRDYQSHADLSTQGAMDAWAPRRSVPANDYRDPDSFNNPYTDLSAANQINKTRGFYAARGTYLRSIQEADGISVRDIKEDRGNDLQNLSRIDTRAAQISRSGGSLEDLQSLDQQRQQILNNEVELRNLYYAPANTRISMGLACIKTGDPMEVLEGQRLIEEAKQKRPEIANDPRLQTMIDKAYQVGYSAHNPENRYPNRNTNRQEYQPNYSNSEYQRSEGSLPRTTPTLPEGNVLRPTPSQPEVSLPPVTPAVPENNVPRPAPWTQQYKPEMPTSVAPELPPARPHAEIPAPAAVSIDRTAPHQTEALIENSKSRISDNEVIGWMHNKYKHLTVEEMTENAKQAQKADDDTPTSWNYFAADRDQRGNIARQDKLLEFSSGRRDDLKNIYETSDQPHSYDSDMARQALITIVKTSAQNMANESMNREIAQESCVQVKELCRANANGRSEMVDAVRIGLTESTHLPGGAKSALIDGLELLATDGTPAIRLETASKIALLALKHDVDNTPRLGSPDRPGEGREEINQRQIRLIQLLDKFGYKDAMTDLEDLVKSAQSDDVRKAAALAISDLQKR